MLFREPQLGFKLLLVARAFGELLTLALCAHVTVVEDLLIACLVAHQTFFLTAYLLRNIFQ